MFLTYLSFALLLATGSFAALQFGYSRPYTMEVGHQPKTLNSMVAWISGFAFSMLVMEVFLLISSLMDWFPNYVLMYKSWFGWTTVVASVMAVIAGAWSYFWREEYKEVHLPDWITATEKYYPKETSRRRNSTPWSDTFIWMDWGCPYSHHIHHGGSYGGGGISITSSSSSSSSSDGDGIGGAGGAAAGGASLLVKFLRFVFVVFIAMLAVFCAYAIVHFLAKLAIQREEAWIKQNRGYADSELVTHVPMTEPRAILFED